MQKVEYQPVDYVSPLPEGWKFSIVIGGIDVEPWEIKPPDADNHSKMSLGHQVTQLLLTTRFDGIISLTTLPQNAGIFPDWANKHTTVRL